ncbi:hypothetical protein ACFQ8S_06870 [Streptomyces virginiae]|uniref:hypothetical protein n=1 Tax=Streptomyces virginiae TaxID=1961 RepID=UPI0036871A5C
MAELEDWTCSFNGLVMGEPDSAISIVAVDGLLTLPELRTSDLTMVQRHGLFAGDDYMNGRTVTLTLEIYGSTREEFTAALNAVQAAFLPVQAEKPLTFRFPGAAADQTAYVMVRPRRRSAPLDLNFANMVCNVVVELFATSPYIEADAVTTLPTLSSPWAGSAPKLRFTIDSSVPVRPVITISNPYNPSINNEITGEHFGVMRAHSYPLVIDAFNERVTANGTDVSGDIAPGSVWPEWSFGDQRLNLYSGSLTGPSTASISFRNRWV